MIIEKDLLILFFVYLQIMEVLVILIVYNIIIQAIKTFRLCLISLYRITGSLLSEVQIYELIKNYAFYLVHNVSDNDYFQIDKSVFDNDSVYIPQNLTEERILICSLAERYYKKLINCEITIYSDLSLTYNNLSCESPTIELLENVIASLEVNYDSYWLLGLTLYNNKQYDKSLIILSKCVKFMEDQNIRNEFDFLCPPYLPSLLCSNIYLYYYERLEEGLEYYFYIKYY